MPRAPGFVVIAACAAGGLAFGFACSVRQPDHGSARAVSSTTVVSDATSDAPDSEHAASDAGSIGDAALAPYVHYARVLHIGDSTVGGNGGLAKALKARFASEGTKYTSDTTVSLGIGTFARSPSFRKLLQQHDPDLVLITLGTNDVFIPSPSSLAGTVQSIAAKSQTGRDRECIWIGPPTWKPDTGIVDVIRANSAPCRFFDSSHMTVARAGDGIHPTDKGGEQWATLIWTFLHDGQVEAPAELFDGGLDSGADASH